MQPRSPDATDATVVETDIPARLDRLPWGRFHTLVVAALGITWILDGLEVTLVGSVAGALKHEFGGEEGVLKRMMPGLFGKTSPPSPPARGAVVAFGSSVLLLALIAAIPLLGSSGQASGLTPANASGAEPRG